MAYFSEAYYKSAALILPIAYRMFDDTVKKNVPGFDWSPQEQQELEMVGKTDRQPVFRPAPLLPLIRRPGMLRRVLGALLDL